MGGYGSALWRQAVVDGMPLSPLPSEQAIQAGRWRPLRIAQGVAAGLSIATCDQTRSSDRGAVPPAKEAGQRRRLGWPPSESPQGYVAADL